MDIADLLHGVVLPTSIVRHDALAATTKTAKPVAIARLATKLLLCRPVFRSEAI